MKFLKTYKLVKEFPAHTVGTELIEQAGEWQFPSGFKVTRQMLHTDFFEPIYISFEVKEVVKVSGKLGVVKSFDGNNVVIWFHGDSANKTTRVDVKKVLKLKTITYWFFNSKLEIHCITAYTDKQIKEHDSKKEVGNCFGSKESCKQMVDKIKFILN